MVGAGSWHGETRTAGRVCVGNMVRGRVRMRGRARIVGEGPQYEGPRAVHGVLEAYWVSGCVSMLRGRVRTV